MIFALLAVAALPAGLAANMNGEYIIANPHANAKFDSNYKVDYFDVYSPPISTQYGEVYWTMMDAVQLPDAIVSRFANKTIALTGYESDQVFKTPDGDKSVPIYWAYNHHYCAWVIGKGAKLAKLPPGHPNYKMPHAPLYEAVDIDPGRDIDGEAIPTSQFISEANGGEYRKSYHGYPAGYAQLVQNPTEFHITPMQIDTHNRFYNGTGFKPSLLPKSAQSPPDAEYSGILECPCSTRRNKTYNQVYSTSTAGNCKAPLRNASECFEAVQQVGISAATSTVADATKPPGCSLALEAGKYFAFWNTAAGAKGACAAAKGEHLVLRGTASSLVDLQLDLDTVTSMATITMAGPAAAWFGVGFNAKAMSDMPYTIVANGTGGIEEHHLANHAPGVQLANSVKVLSNTVSAGVRTVVLTRPFKGATGLHFTFDPKQTDIPFINAVGSGPAFAYHKDKASSSLALVSRDSPTCVCDGGIDKRIDGVPFRKDCAPEPTGDLLAQHNPTCDIETYVGGLSCCHHQWNLLDADQEIPAPVDTYHLKFRFWFQEYVPATAAAPASHRNLDRFYFQTEAFAGEYDVPKASPGTPPSQTIHTITAHWQVSDMFYGSCDPLHDPKCKVNGTGINLMYAGPHCHAPSCLSMDLYNADTGKLLCHVEPTFGTTKDVIFDEAGYLLLPPCLWGSEDEGLVAPDYLAFNSNLTSIKKNNNTYGHYGEMASWQMRGVVV